MKVTASIKGIKYHVSCAENLSRILLNDLNINNSPSHFLLINQQNSYGVSKWVSPKRTRSYPFERIYNTLNSPKRITVIPIIKDEGAAGDRDFIQWDTISLMSLLDVYVIFGYYNTAKKSCLDNKITEQKFDNEYVKNKINEISNYHSSALHWNLNEIDNTLPNLIDSVKDAYSHLAKELGVQFHSSNGLEKFKKQFCDSVSEFMITSRNKAKEAQNRERQTIQPKEFLTNNSKGTITISNYLGGIYYFTTDEMIIKDNEIHLIEGKHSINSKLPSISDIKDGLLKMVLYCNLTDITVENINYSAKPILKLTSTKIIGKIISGSSSQEINSFKLRNLLNSRNNLLVDNIFKEAQINGFEVVIEGV